MGKVIALLGGFVKLLGFGEALHVMLRKYAFAIEEQ